MVNGQATQFGLWNTAGQQKHDRVRRLSYPQTDVFIMCFSIDRRASHQNILHRWGPEITRFEPNVPIVLVGTKSDLRHQRDYDPSQVLFFFYLFFL